ncbi:MAG: response regulator [Caldimonas sp.]
MNKLRAFVIEDSPVILESLTGALEEQANVEVVGSAADENKAIEWMDSRTNGCDVVIVDIFLRSGSGLGVLKRINTYASPPERVVLTNYATSDMRSRCHALGAEAVFDKSSEIDELMAWLASRQDAAH